MRDRTTSTFIDVRSAKCFVCGEAFFGRLGRLQGETHADLTGHLVVVEVLTRTTYNSDAMAPEVAAAVVRAAR